MAGQEVFKTAVTNSLRDLLSVLSDAGLDKDDITYYVLHQANFRINDFIRHRFNMDTTKFPVNMDRYGNTSSASIPMLLDELNRNGKLKKAICSHLALLVQDLPRVRVSSNGINNYICSII